MKITADQITSFLLLISSGLFLAGITPYSPIYVLFGLAAIMFALRQATRFSISNSALVNFNFFLCLYFFFTQLFFTSAKFPNVMGIALPYMYFFMGIQVLRHVSKETLLRYIRIMTWLSIVLFVADAFNRFTHPTYSRMNPFTGEVKLLPLTSRYKFSSIMYMDANFVGIQAVCLYFFLTYLIKEKMLFPLIRFTRLCVGICVVLTTSRSAIISLIVYHLVFSRISFPFKLTPRIIIGTVASLIIMFISGYIVLQMFKDDGSFLSKFEILELALRYVQTAMKPLNWLFGLGAGETPSVIGIGAHNIAVGLILETGFISTLLFIINISWIGKRTKGKALYLILPFLTMGFSLATFAIPYLFIQLAFIYVVENGYLENMSLGKQESFI